MKKAVAFLAESNAFFRDLDLNMPNTKSKLYSQLHNIAYYHLHPVGNQSSKPTPTLGKGRGRSQYSKGKMLRASPRKKKVVQIEDDATMTEQSTIHKANRFSLDSPDKPSMNHTNTIFDSTAQKDED